MLWAVFNDFMQRFLTLNKREQKRNLAKRLETLDIKAGGKVLDYGCGTGLFAGVFTKLQLKYYGYDIDEKLVRYANSLYQSKDCRFTTSMEELKKEAPFNLIIANCCFHHIDDFTLSEQLGKIKKLLIEEGTFLVIDLLSGDSDAPFLRKLYMQIERGAYVRNSSSYKKIVEKHFKIVKSEFDRSHLFSWNKSPVYNDIVVFHCKST